jgi:type IV pilus assembly protein PilA
MIRLVSDKAREMRQTVLKAAPVPAGGERGFTLIELLVAVLIIGILAAIAIPSFLNQRTKGFDASAKELARTAQTAAETIATDNAGSYASVSASQLNSYEATLQTAAGGNNAYVSAAGPLTGTTAGYYVVAIAAGTSDKFEVIRISTGLLYRACGSSAWTPPTANSAPSYTGATEGGCVNGSW